MVVKNEVKRCFFSAVILSTIHVCIMVVYAEYNNTSRLFFIEPGFGFTMFLGLYIIYLTATSKFYISSIYLIRFKALKEACIFIQKKMLMPNLIFVITFTLLTMYFEENLNISNVFKCFRLCTLLFFTITILSFLVLNLEVYFSKKISIIGGLSYFFTMKYWLTLENRYLDSFGLDSYNPLFYYLLNQKKGIYQIIQYTELCLLSLLYLFLIFYIVDYVSKALKKEVVNK